MKTDAKIEWLIDDECIGLQSSTTETVAVDCDYVDATAESVIEWIENELADKYGTSLRCSKNENDDGDFIVTNMEDVLIDIGFQEYKEKLPIYGL